MCTEMRLITLFAAISGTASASPKAIACVGDSITEGSHASSKSYTYPAQLQVRLDIAFGKGTYEVVNLGVSGATAQQAADKPYWLTHEYTALMNFTWDIAIVMLGTNGTYLYAFRHQQRVHTQTPNGSTGMRQMRVAPSGENLAAGGLR